MAHTRRKPNNVLTMPALSKNTQVQFKERTRGEAYKRYLHVPSLQLPPDYPIRPSPNPNARHVSKSSPTETIPRCIQFTRACQPPIANLSSGERSVNKKFRSRPNGGQPHQAQQPPPHKPQRRPPRPTTQSVPSIAPSPRLKPPRRPERHRTRSISSITPAEISTNAVEPTSSGATQQRRVTPTLQINTHHRNANKRNREETRKGQG